MDQAPEVLDRVMLIAAHPDDPEFGAGGTMAKLARQGKHITYVLLTSGDKGSHDPGVRPGQLATQREQEQRNAAAEAGVENVLFSALSRWGAGEHIGATRPVGAHHPAK